MIPGELLVDAGELVLNPGRRTATLVVQNTGDRPIQVGSHYHFAETNARAALRPRRRARHAPQHRLGHRGALRARPAAHRRAGRLRRRRASVYGFRGLVQGQALMADASPRRAYAEMFGPTVGDRVRLADTGLVDRGRGRLHPARRRLRRGGEVRRRQDDPRRHGPEPARRRPRSPTPSSPTRSSSTTGASSRPTSRIKAGRIAALGKAGNPDVQPGVDIVIGPGTEIIAGEGMIVTAGGIDSHIHFICPQQIEEALASGVTTMLGGGTGPATGTFATTCTPGPWHIHSMLKAAEAFPMNLGFMGKGNASLPARARRAGRGRRLRPEAARGLGHDAGGDRQLPLRRRAPRRPGDDPHRHAQRIGLRRGHDRRLQGPRDRDLPHRGRRRRPRARHHQASRAWPNVLPSSTNPTMPYTVNTRRRAPRHADGLPSPRPGDRRGPGLRREPDPRARRSPPRTCCTTWACSR